MQFDNVSFSGGLAIIPPPLVPPGQVAYTTPGTYSWAVPAGVTSIAAVCVGAGGVWYGFRQSGGGAGLRYINNLPVTPGETLTVTVGTTGADGAHGINSSIRRSSNTLVFAQGGSSTAGGTGIATGAGPFGGTIGGGNGGNGNGATNFVGGAGGGGAGGYSGNGGNAAIGGTGQSGAAGSGGGGGGGGAGNTANMFTSNGGVGGGVGIFGEGTSGAGGAGGGAGQPGGGGSGSTSVLFGGGGSGKASDEYGTNGAPGGGAVRIIWGEGRAFPSTNTTDQ